MNMAKNDENKKLRVSWLRIALIFVVLFLVMEAIFYISFQSGDFWPFNTMFYIYTPVLFATSVLFAVLTIRGTWYMIDSKKLTHSKMGHTKDYYWKDIIYIDEEWSRKHKMMLFYLADGKERFLAFDKEGLILEYALKYGRLIDREDFLRRFPKAKL